MSVSIGSQGAPPHKFAEVSLSRCSCTFCSGLITDKKGEKAVKCLQCNMAFHLGCVRKAQTVNPYNVCLGQADIINAKFKAQTDTFISHPASIEIKPKDNVVIITKDSSAKTLKLNTLVFWPNGDKCICLGETKRKVERIKFDTTTERDGCLQVLNYSRKAMKPQPQPPQENIMNASCFFAGPPAPPQSSGHRPHSPSPPPHIAPAPSPSPHVATPNSSRVNHGSPNRPVSQGSPTESPPVAVAASWACSRCTYINTGGSVCAMCDLPRSTTTTSPMVSSHLSSVSNAVSPTIHVPQVPDFDTGAPYETTVTAPDDDQPWECPGCTVKNDALKLQCTCCLLQRPCTRSDDPGDLLTLQDLQGKLLDGYRHNRITEVQLNQIRTAMQQTTVHRRQESFEINDSPVETVTKHWYDWESKKWKEKEIQVIIDWRPFAEGNIRVALRMLDLSRPGGNQSCVAKFQKPDFFEGNDSYFVDVEMQAYCQAIASAYNAHHPPKQVCFLEAWAIERHGADIPVHQQVLAAEPYIDPTNYVKYNNNFGFVHPMSRNTPAAFSHFSFEFTKHRLMVVDIQGVVDVYTDPQIHTTDGQGFGIGNCGAEGIGRFFATHCCNPLCQYLRLPAMKNKPIATEGTVLPAALLAPAGGMGSGSPRAPSKVFQISEFIRELNPKRDSATLEDLSVMNMTTEEFNKMVDLYNAHDVDKNGVLSFTEVVQLLKAIQFEFTTDNVQYLFSCLDKNGDGLVNFKEFVLWYKGFE